MDQGDHAAAGGGRGQRASRRRLNNKGPQGGVRSPTRPAVLDTKRKAKKHDAHEQTNLDGPDQTRGSRRGKR